MRKTKLVLNRTAEGKQAGFASRRCNDLDTERQLVLRSGAGRVSTGKPTSDTMKVTAR